MGTVHVMDHPLILHKLSLMRDSQTGVRNSAKPPVKSQC